MWQPPWWIALLAVPALMMNQGWVFATGLLGFWALLVCRARTSRSKLTASLHLETEAEQSRHRDAARAFQVGVVEAANRGDTGALRQLMDRWHSQLPPGAKPFSVQLGGSVGTGYQLLGKAIGLKDIPTATSRAGSGGRTLVDNRKASELDQDLTELNAAAVLSLLRALFADADRAYVHLSVKLEDATLGEIAWVRLATHVGYAQLHGALSGIDLPSEALRVLGGTVGCRRARQFYPAKDPLFAETGNPMPDPEDHERNSRAQASAIPQAWMKATPQRKDGVGPDPEALSDGKINPEREGKVLEAIRSGTAGSTVQALMAATGLREPTVKHFGISASQAGLVDAFRIGATRHFVVRENDAEATPEAMAIRGGVRALSESEGLKKWRQLGRAGFAPIGCEAASASAAPGVEPIPAPPAERVRAPGEPSLRDLRGPFGIVAKRWADYGGDCNATFVPFHHYYPAYENLDARQSRCYFAWRKAFREGRTPTTDLSYLFVHVYELIHIVGVPDLRRAASELERLWTAYRPAYPKLDNYLVPWIADLYATEGLTGEVAAWYRRVASAGALIPDREAVTDLYWAASEYSEMPRLVLATLAGDPKLGTNKFCHEQNANGWVDRGYREALATADEAFRAKHGKGLREATVEADGLRPLDRQAFNGAVYDWKRVRVTIALIPNLGDTSLAVRTFQSAARYAENRLREQRKYKAKLRGVEIDPDIAIAIDHRLATFVQVTRARTRVTIDLAKAKELEQESSAVRDILLGGLEEPAPAPTGQPVGEPDPAVSNTPTGLLTDLAAIQAAITACTSQARGMLEGFLAVDWEMAATDPRLAAAAGGALVGPLIDEINGHSLTAAGDLLVVAEGDRYVVQEDFRDEVYCVLRGSLEGYGNPEPAPCPEAEADSHGFGPTEMETLRLFLSGEDLARKLTALATVHGSSVLLLIDRVNELALTSAHGDVLLDAGQDPPALIEDGRAWVESLLARFPSDSTSSPRLPSR